MAIHIKLVLKNDFLRKAVYIPSKWRADYFMRMIGPYLEDSDRILDVGAGSCIVSKLLSEKNFQVMPVDVDNLSLIPGMEPIVYDGCTIPFQDNSFDVSLLLSVLHHVRNPEEVIREAVRVSRKVIIVEDIYANPIEKYATFLIDSVNNQEFRGHPHSNKTDKEWRSLFDELGLTLHNAKYNRWLIAVQHATYYLEK